MQIPQTSVEPNYHQEPEMWEGHKERWQAVIDQEGTRIRVESLLQSLDLTEYTDGVEDYFPEDSDRAEMGIPPTSGQWTYQVFVDAWLRLIEADTDDEWIPNELLFCVLQNSEFRDGFADEIDLFKLYMSTNHPTVRFKELDFGAGWWLNRIVDHTQGEGCPLCWFRDDYLEGSGNKDNYETTGSEPDTVQVIANPNHPRNTDNLYCYSPGFSYDYWLLKETPIKAGSGNLFDVSVSLNSYRAPHEYHILNDPYASGSPIISFNMPQGSTNDIEPVAWVLSRDAWANPDNIYGSTFSGDPYYTAQYLMSSNFTDNLLENGTTDFFSIWLDGFRRHSYQNQTLWDPLPIWYPGIKLTIRLVGIISNDNIMKPTWIKFYVDDLEAYNMDVAKGISVTGVVDGKFNVYCGAASSVMGAWDNLCIKTNYEA